MLTLGLGGCTGDPIDGPHVERVRPAPVIPGEVIAIQGVGFGEVGSVAIGGRPLRELGREPTRITAEVPRDIPGGEAVLVVYTSGRPSPGFAIEVAGPPGDPPPPRRFPEGIRGARDGGVPAPDEGVRPDAGRRDAAPPDARPAEEWLARFNPDGVGGQTVYLEEADARPGILELLVRVRDGGAVRGLALHLEYDRGLLEFLDAQPEQSRGFVARQIGPGRLALGRRFRAEPDDEPVTRLRFRVLGPGEGRIDLPARRRTVRDGGNRDIPGFRFSGGSVRVERAR